MDGVTSTVLGTVPAGSHQLTVESFEQQAPNSPVLLMAPAMGVPARYYDPLVHSLHQRGHTVVRFDLRGQGQSTPKAARGVRFGYQELIDDLDGVLDLVDTAYPQAPRFLLGHSLGGQLSLLYASTRQSRVRGVAMVAAGSAWWRAFRGRGAARTLVGPQFVAALSTLIGYWPGHRFGFGGQQPSGLMRDWARHSRTGRFTPASYSRRAVRSSTDFEAAMRSLRLPVLAISVEGDDLAPATAVDHLTGKARHAVRTRRHYTRESAGTDRLGHFAWVHNADPLADWIAEWSGTHPVAASRLGS